MSDSLFIDVGNLNVLYKLKGKFCVGTSYLSCPDKLIIDAQALGSSFDVYLSMWPRQKDEGDVIIQSLSLGGVPFVALKTEINAILDYACKIPGANRIYLCNALANFMIPSRVGNFQAVLCCGNRYALVDVRDKLLAGLKLYDNQREFYKDMGDDFACYGDLDIIDIDNVKAQYPELTAFKKNILVTLVPLIMSYHSQYKVEIEDVRKEIEGYIPEVKKLKPVKEEKKLAPIPEYDRSQFKQKKTKKSLDIDWISVTLGAAACLGLFFCGVGWNMRNVDSVIREYEQRQTQYTVSADLYTPLKNIYLAGHNTAGYSSEILDYAKKTEIDITVCSLEGFTDSVLLNFSCQSAEAKDQFITYLQQRYVIGAVNERQSLTNPDGSITFEYGVTVVP